MTAFKGMVAAGHPRVAEVGAEVLRAGGNAVDAAIAAILASWVCEPLLTGPGAGGYMLVCGGGLEATLLDFFVAAPGAGRSPGEHGFLTPVDVDFGDTKQVFNCGAASCGVPGAPAGIAEAAVRWGSLPLADLAAPAAQLARDGVPLNAEQGYVSEILVGILTSTPGVAAAFAPRGTPLRTGEAFRSEALAETIERLGADGAAPFYTGDIGAAIVETLRRDGGMVTAEDLASYAALARVPARVTYRGREVLTNPPPSAGGILLALALGTLDARTDGSPTTVEIAHVMEEMQTLRTPEFVEGLAEDGFLGRFLDSRLGATTHISVLDGDGRACSVTCTNGEGSGVVVPETGIHLNNIMGEEDLNPLGFFRNPAGRRMPSMMAPTAVLGPDGTVQLVVGSAGSNRIRSAILQVILNVVDHGMTAEEAIAAPRIHHEAGVVYAEPGIDVQALEATDREVVAFRASNLFFGGAQAINRDPSSGIVSGAGDPRRGGAAVAA